MTKIIRGDSYALRRPLKKFEFFDEDMNPLSLQGCTIQTTYKPVVTPIESDADDTTAQIKHELQIDGNGDVVVQNGLYVVGTVADGVIEERLTATESAQLAPNATLTGDLQLIDPFGEVFTWIFVDKLETIDGVTHRPPTTP